jgi:hypothetical protein
MFGIARQLSLDLSADVGILCDKADVHEKMKSGLHHVITARDM